ncbi:hypothetical protein SAMN06273567_1061, partial [Geodermatophilus aquaeductus]
ALARTVGGVTDVRVLLAGDEVPDGAEPVRPLP